MQKSAIFSERLVQRRKRLDWTQDELADRSGVSKRSIVDYEAGKTDPGLEQLEKLAQALQVRVAFLVGDDSPVPETDQESVRLAFSALKAQATTLVEQIAFYERQLCSAKRGLASTDGVNPASRPFSSISASEAKASADAAERALRLQKVSLSSGVDVPTGDKHGTSRGISKGSTGRPESQGQAPG